jgi:hypothetical protein
MSIDKFHVFLCLFSPRVFPVQTLLQLLIFQITRPCPIKYKSMKVQHEQVEVDRSQTLTEFIKEDRVNLTRGVLYTLSDMALSVHGTTVIQQGPLVNDILSS